MNTLGDWWQYLVNNKLEALAFVTSVAGVWYTAKEKIINWPINILASILYAYIFYADILYGDAALNLFFIVMCAYGWYEWVYGKKQNHELAISPATMRTLVTLLLIAALGSVLIGKLEVLYTKSNVPYLDGITTAMSLGATWLAARKFIENWLVWIVTDIIYIAEYIIKGLYLTAVLYFIFTLLAVYGYYAWKKQLTTSAA